MTTWDTTPFRDGPPPGGRFRGGAPSHGKVNVMQWPRGNQSSAWARLYGSAEGTWKNIFRSRQSDLISRQSVLISRFGDLLIRFGDLITRFGDLLSRFGDLLSRFGDF